MTFQEVSLTQCSMSGETDITKNKGPLMGLYFLVSPSDRRRERQAGEIAHPGRLGEID